MSEIKTKILDTVAMASYGDAQCAIRVDDGENVIVIGFDGSRQEAEQVASKFTGAFFAVLPPLEDILADIRKEQASLSGSKEYYS